MTLPILFEFSLFFIISHFGILNFVGYPQISLVPFSVCVAFEGTMCLLCDFEYRRVMGADALDFKV